MQIVSPRPAPARFTIAVYGPDGAGKTTVLDMIEDALAPSFGGNILRRHLRPHRLPSRAELRGKRGTLDGRSTGEVELHPIDPHAAPMPGRLWSLVRLAWFVSDYTLGALWPDGTTPRLTLYDRFVDDLLIDPRRHCLNLPQGMIRLALSPLPRPDLSILLWGDPATITRRKRELTQAEVERQIARLHMMAARSDKAALLRTDGPLADTRRDLAAILHRHLPFPALQPAFAPADTAGSAA